MTDFAGVGAAYGEQLARGLALTGETAAYFAHRRVMRLRETLEANRTHPETILDFGCGSGAAFAPLRAVFPRARILGFEPDPNLRAVACDAAHRENVELIATDTLEPRGDADVVYCNGVFHHIPVSERADAMRRIRASLKPGGYAVIWENSPFNPGTRWVMSRVPFDNNARLLTPGALRALQQAQGLEPVSTEYHFVFPRALAFLRPLESGMRSLPFGGQYVVSARAPL